MISKVKCLFGKETDPFRTAAIEAHLCLMADQDTVILYLWHSPACVELGCGLDLEQTCKLTAVREKRVCLRRRLSGGKAFYMDGGTLGYSLIVPRSCWNIRTQGNMLLNAMVRLGLSMQCTAPYACGLEEGAAPTIFQSYYLGGNIGLEHGCIHISTSHPGADAVLKFPASFTDLQEVKPQITDNHVVNALFQAMEAIYGLHPTWLNEDIFDETDIRQKAVLFHQKNWIIQPPLEDEHAASKSFPWGNLTVGIRVNRGCILQCRLRSDAMEAALLRELESLLNGTPCLKAAVTTRLEQKVSQLGSPLLKRIVREACGLICERISQLDPEKEIMTGE